MKEFEIAKMIQAYRHSQDKSCMRICKCAATDTHTNTLFYKLITCAHTQTHAVHVCVCMANHNTILMPHYKSAANPTAKTIYSEVRRKFPKLMKLVSPASDAYANLLITLLLLCSLSMCFVSFDNEINFETTLIKTKNKNYGKRVDRI